MRSKHYPRPYLLLLVILTSCKLSPENLEFRDAWIRPADASMNTAAYLVIESRGEQDRLHGASSPIAERIEVHRSYADEAGVMRMQERAFVIIPANESIIFEPGGLHIMFIDLNRDLVLDDLIELNFQFENQGEVSIDVPVEIR